MKINPEHLSGADTTGARDSAFVVSAHDPKARWVGQVPVTRIGWTLEDPEGLHDALMDEASLGSLIETVGAVSTETAVGYKAPQPSEIRALIKRARISQAEAARRIGVTSRSMRYWVSETASRPIPFAEWYTLRAILG